MAVVPEGWLPVGQRRNFDSAQSRAHRLATQRWDGQGALALSAAPQVPFTGIVRVAVTPYAMAVDPCIHENHGTYALCSSQVRTVAQVGDVIVIVSPPWSSAGTRGLQTEERLVLSVGLVESLVPVARYHSLGAPDWVLWGRPDCIYKAKLVDKDGVTITARARAGVIRDLDFQRVRILPQHCQSTDDGAWLVDYGNATVRFELRSRVRFHPLQGVNRVHAGTRWRDFTGYVLCTGLCRTFSGSGTDMMALPSCLQHVAFGRGVRVVKAPRRSALRRWLEAQLGQQL